LAADALARGAGLQEFRGLRYLLVYDEIHRILPKFGGSGEGFIQIERGCREFRKWGIGILLISQVLQDFVGQIKANINTQVQMKTRDEGDLNGIKTNFGESYIHELVKSPVGSGMVQNSAWNGGTPNYITFRPIFHSVVRLSDDELDQYNKYNEIVDNLEYQLEQLSEEDQDVFDLTLELKLSKDKIKSGNFNMVEIYLEGLTPRIEKVWQKIGKTPKKLEVKLVNEDELKAEMEKAKADHEKAEVAAKAAEAEAAAKAASQESEKEEEKMDPELVEANLTAIKELSGQVEESIANSDWARANELIMELTATPLPKDKRKDKDKKIEELKKKLEEAQNPPEEEKEGEKKEGDSAPA